MTQLDYIKDILNIKDVNVHFYENFLEISEYKGVNTKIFHGYLTYDPSHCDRCGLINNGPEDIIAWGWKKNYKIKVTKVCGYNALLLLDKRRFKCNHCGKTFIARTNVVEFHKQISNDTKLNITLALIHKGIEKDIARNNNVSINTVNRILHNISEDKLVKRQDHLPKILGIDEFKGPKDTIYKMAFIIVNEENKNNFDLLNSRKKRILKTILNAILKGKEIRLNLLLWTYTNLTIS